MDQKKRMTMKRHIYMAVSALVMICLLAACGGKAESAGGKTAADQGKAADVRTEILRDGGRFMHRPVNFRTWTAYQMIRFCPRMIPLVLPVYRFFRLLLAKVIGR